MAAKKSDSSATFGFLDFVPQFVHPAGVHGTPEDPSEVTGPLESICGGVDNSQPVEQYDGTLGVTVGFVAQHEGPVGNIQWNSNLATLYNNPGTVSGARFCTGTLISNDLFLTAGHCFDQTGGGWVRPMIDGTNTIIPPTEIATNMHVDFNYQADPAGKLRTIESFAITELMEYRLNGLDYAIVRLAGSPGSTYGFTGVSANDANLEGEMLCIIQHPAGVPKRIEAGPSTGVDGNFLLYNDIDTLGGSSGSGVLGTAGTIVAVHTNGGCDKPAPGNNRGVRISAINAASPILSNMLFPISC